MFAEPAALFTMGRDWERGVEFGMLFAWLKEHGAVEMAVHADLAELVIRLAEYQGKPFRGQPHSHDSECGCPDDGEDYLDVRIG